jgi:hypothetical protein
MTAGEVETRMDYDELFMWAAFLFGWDEHDAEELSVEDEITAWSR